MHGRKARPAAGRQRRRLGRAMSTRRRPQTDRARASIRTRIKWQPVPMVADAADDSTSIRPWSTSMPAGSPAPYTAGGRAAVTASGWQGALRLAGSSRHQRLSQRHQALRLGHHFNSATRSRQNPAMLCRHDQHDRIDSQGRDRAGSRPRTGTQAAHSVVNSNSAVSPRIVAVPLVNPDPARLGRNGGNPEAGAGVGIVGFFLESCQRRHRQRAAGLRFPVSSARVEVCPARRRLPGPSCSFVEFRGISCK